jgi:KEOPS complex subunit Cgi121
MFSLLIEEIDQHFLLALGFPRAKVGDPAAVLNQLRSKPAHVEVQLLRADLVAGIEHLRLAANKALRSFYGKKPRSRSLAVELLLFVSCQRQISKAIKLLGVEPADEGVVLVALGKSRGSLQELEERSNSIFGDTDQSLIEIGSKAKFANLQLAYSVSNREVEAARFEGESKTDVLKRLIIERSALLSIAD